MLFLKLYPRCSPDFVYLSARVCSLLFKCPLCCACHHDDELIVAIFPVVGNV